MKTILSKSNSNIKRISDIYGFFASAFVKFWYMLHENNIYVVMPTKISLNTSIISWSKRNPNIKTILSKRNPNMKTICQKGTQI